MTDHPPSFSTFLRGVSFRPIEAKVIVKGLEEDTSLDLVRDSGNEYDHNAIKVLDREFGVFLGFIAKEDAKDIAPWMDGGWHFTCQVGERFSSYDLELRVEPGEHATAA